MNVGRLERRDLLRIVSIIVRRKYLEVVTRPASNIFFGFR